MPRLAVLALVCFGAASADEKPAGIDAKKLVGKWQLVEGFEGLTIRVEFTKDGKMLDTIDGHGVPGLQVAGISDYKIDGSKIVAAAVGEKSAETMTVARLTDDELVLQFKKGDKVTYKRVKDK